MLVTHILYTLFKKTVFVTKNNYDTEKNCLRLKLLLFHLKQSITYTNYLFNYSKIED